MSPVHTQTTCHIGKHNEVVGLDLVEQGAEGVRFETPDDTETLGPDLTASVLSQSFTKAGGR
jgi:hypothetical protein